MRLQKFWAALWFMGTKFNLRCRFWAFRSSRRSTCERLERGGQRAGWTWQWSAKSSPHPTLAHSALKGSTGQVTNSFVFCWLFTIKDWCVKCATQSSCFYLLFLAVSWDIRTKRGTPHGVLVFHYVVEEAVYKASQRPLKGHRLSAQKALPGSGDGDEGVAGRNGRE